MSPRTRSACSTKRSVIFCDTSALLAFLVPRDQYHARALGADVSIRQRREVLWTIDPVLTELWRLLRGGLGGARADGLVGGLLDSGMRCQALDPVDYARAWQIGAQWPDQTFSLTDRQAFAAMERLRRMRAWSYDSDFSIVRLGAARNRAIELV